MVLVELFQQAIVGILVGYLAITNALAEQIEPLFPTERPDAVAVHTTKEITSEEVEKELASLPSEYERGGAIPSILIANTAYQQAAVSGAASTSEMFPGAGKNRTQQVADALLSIYCEYRTDEYLRVTTGTGFFVHEKGIVLTNAHVAQFLLLAEANERIQDAECVLRSGDPAKPRYRAELLYISPLWISENAKLISEERPVGTGERDYALLYAAEAVDQSALPAVFPYLPLDTSLLSRRTTGEEMLIAGYLPESLSKDSTQSVLTPVIASSTVGELYTFGSNYADVIDLSDSPVGAHGASGGPVVQSDGTVIGIIATKGDPETGGSQSLRALTLSYVDRTMIEETSHSLLRNLEGDPAVRGAIFRQALVPTLSKLLLSELE